MQTTNVPLQSSRSNLNAYDIPGDDSDDVSTEEDEKYRVGDHKYKRRPLQKIGVGHLQRMRYDAEELWMVNQRYNLWTGILGSEASSSRPWTRGKRALQTMKDIELLSNQLNEKVSEFKENVFSFVRGTSDYINGSWFTSIDDLTGEFRHCASLRRIPTKH